MILIMMANEDADKISPELINDNVYITDPQYVERIFKQQYIDNILITEKYVESVGKVKIKRFVEMLSLMEPNVYVMICNGGEELPYIESETVAVLPVKIEQLTLEKVEALVGKRMTGQATSASATVQLNEMVEVVAKAKILMSSPSKEEGLKNFLLDNHVKIIEALDGRIELDKQLRIEREENEKLFNKLISLSQSVSEAKMNFLKEDIERLREDRNKLYATLVDSLSMIEELRTAQNKVNITIESNKIAVVYFKQLDDIGFHIIFEAIYRRLSSQKMFVKALILEEADNHFKKYDGEYIRFKDNMRINDLLETDKIIRYGNGLNIIKELCNPLYGLQVLLVYDKRSGSEIHINTSPKLLPMYLAEDMEDIDLDIPSVNLISPTAGNYQNIEKIPNDNSIDLWVARTDLFRYVNKFIHNALMGNK